MIKNLHGKCPWVWAVSIGETVLGKQSVIKTRKQIDDENMINVYFKKGNISGGVDFVFIK